METPAKRAALVAVIWAAQSWPCVAFEMETRPTTDSGDASFPEWPDCYTGRTSLGYWTILDGVKMVAFVR